VHNLSPPSRARGLKPSYEYTMDDALAIKRLKRCWLQFLDTEQADAFLHGCHERLMEMFGEWLKTHFTDLAESPKGKELLSLRQRDS